MPGSSMSSKRINVLFSLLLIFTFVQFVVRFNYTKYEEKVITTTRILGDGGVDENGFTLAIVHVGPHKTGSTSIQKKIWELREFELNDDGFEPMPRIPAKSDWTYKSLSAIAFALQDNGREVVDETWPTFTNFLDEASRRQRSVLLSSEDFSAPTTNLSQLAALLTSRFDAVKIVIVYRRYFSWLVSHYCEDARYALWTDKDHYYFPELLDREMRTRTRSILGSKWINLQQANAMKRRYTEQFGAENVVVQNYHNDRNLLEDFFCTSIQGELEHRAGLGNTACRRIRREIAEFGNTRENVRFPLEVLEYELLAQKARNEGYIDARCVVPKDKESLKRGGQRIASFVRDVLHLNFTSLPHKSCIQQAEVRPPLWNLTLEQELEVVPSDWYDAVGRDELHQEFEEFMEQDIHLCNPEWRIIIEDERWVTFFCQWEPTSQEIEMMKSIGVQWGGPRQSAAEIDPCPPPTTTSSS